MDFDECNRKRIALHTLLLVTILTILLVAISIANKLLDRKYIKSAQKLNLLINGSSSGTSGMGEEESAMLLHCIKHDTKTLQRHHRRRGETSSSSAAARLINYYDLHDSVANTVSTSVSSIANNDDDGITPTSERRKMNSFATTRKNNITAIIPVHNNNNNKNKRRSYNNNNISMTEKIFNDNNNNNNNSSSNRIMTSSYQQQQRHPTSLYNNSSPGPSGHRERCATATPMSGTLEMSNINFKLLKRSTSVGASYTTTSNGIVSTPKNKAASRLYGVSRGPSFLTLS